MGDRFNTKKVRLKPLCEKTVKRTRARRFNTKKVRLKHERGGAACRGDRGFNTKKVRLKRTRDLLVGHAFGLRFNTKKVRLKLAQQAYQLVRRAVFQYQKGAIKTVFEIAEHVAYTWVSIPKRCD